MSWPASSTRRRARSASTSRRACSIRSGSGPHVYGRRERARLQLILRAKSLGLSLREIKRYLDLYGERGEGRSKQLEMVVQRTGEMIAELEAKRAEIDKTLAELRHIRRESQKTLDARED